MAKLTVEFNDALTKKLEEMAANENTTKVDIIRRALALYNFVESEVDESRKRRLAIAEDGKVVVEIVKP